jgi:hypothetical protein
MAVNTYWASKYFRDSNDAALQSIPRLQPGQLGVWDDTIVIAAATSGLGTLQAIAGDLLKIARMPAGHRVRQLEMYIGDIDSGTVLRMDFGITGNSDLLAAALDVDTAGGYVVPANADVLQSLNETTPSTDYDLLGTVTTAANGNVFTAATCYFRVTYYCASNGFSPSDGPAVVEGTQ